MTMKNEKWEMTYGKSLSRLKRFSISISIASLTILPITIPPQRLIPIARGWSKKQIHAVIFRHNSLISHGNTQYTAFYDEAGKLVLATRKLGTTDWLIRQTQYTGDVNDAHKSISIAVD